MVTANNNASNVSVLLGNAVKKLLPVDGTTGLESGYAQGASPAHQRTSITTVGRAKAGDTVYVASEKPGNPPSAGYMDYEIEDAEGNYLTAFYTNSSRPRGQSNPIAAGLHRHLSGAGHL